MNEVRALIDSWNAITAVTQNHALSDSDKLRRYCNIADVHTALTGDDSLVHPLLRAGREAVNKQVPRILKEADKRRAERENGVVDLI